MLAASPEDVDEGRVGGRSVESGKFAEDSGSTESISIVRKFTADMLLGGWAEDVVLSGR